MATNLAETAYAAFFRATFDGLLVLDEQNRLVAANPASRKILALDDSAVGQPLHVLCPSLCNIVETLQANSATFPIFSPPGPPGHNLARQIDVHISSLMDEYGQARGFAVHLRDAADPVGTSIAIQRLSQELEREMATRKDIEQELRGLEHRLEEQAAEQSSTLTGLYEVILVAGQSLSLHDLQQQILAKIMAALGADAGCIYQHDNASRTLQLIVHSGLQPAVQEQLAALPPAWLLEDTIPRTITDLVADLSVPLPLRSSGLGAYLGMPISLLGHVTGALSVFWNRARSISLQQIALFNTMADQLGIIVENARLRQRGEEAAALRERRRLARDLHDSVTQSLHSLVLSAETASNRLKQGKLDLLEASLLQQALSARQALKEMRLLLFELRLATLDEVNLEEALKIRLDAVESRAGVKVEADIEHLSFMPRSTEKELYCIAMEALNNSLKHARATLLNVRLRPWGNGVELDIADNGRGFESYATKLGGMGLQSMAERAERLGGTLTITSAPGAGTRVHLVTEALL